jgi:hypothetical protein
VIENADACFRGSAYCGTLVYGGLYILREYDYQYKSFTNVRDVFAVQDSVTSRPFPVRRIESGVGGAHRCVRVVQEGERHILRRHLWKVDEFFSGLHIKDKHLVRTAFIRIESSMTVKGESYVAWQ